MSNQNNVRAFVEVTALALMLFVVPFGYWKGRDSLIQMQDKVYYKMFGIKKEHLEKFKQRLAEEQEKELKESEANVDKETLKEEQISMNDLKTDKIEKELK